MSFNELSIRNVLRGQDEPANRDKTCPPVSTMPGTGDTWCRRSPAEKVALSFKHAREVDGATGECTLTMAEYYTLEEAS